MERVDQQTENEAGPFRMTVEPSGGLAPARAAMRSWLGAVVPPERVDEVLLASGEALANAIEHGRPPIDIDMQWSTPDTLDVSIKDSGVWKVSAEASTRGLGIPIMTALMHIVSVETTDGTEVRLRRRFDDLKNGDWPRDRRERAHIDE